MHSYKFNVGDLLKLTGNLTGISSPANQERLYRSSLRVVFRFWNGMENVYVVTAEDGVGLILVERDAELQEAGAGKADCPVDGREKHLYHIENKVGEFYIVAHSFDEAVGEYEERLHKAEYGLFMDRRVSSIDHLAVEEFCDDKQLFDSSGANLIVVRG